MIDYKKYSLAQARADFSEINIIPFTDIILVLLVIFMASAPSLYQSGLGVQLPKSRSMDQSKEQAWTLTLKMGGGLYMDNQLIQPWELKQRLARLSERQQAKLSTILRADKRASHGDVVRVLDLLRQANIHRIYLGTQRE